MLCESDYYYHCYRYRKKQRQNAHFPLPFEAQIRPRHKRIKPAPGGTLNPKKAICLHYDFYCLFSYQIANAKENIKLILRILNVEKGFPKFCFKNKYFTIDFK